MSGQKKRAPKKRAPKSKSTKPVSAAIMSGGRKRSGPTRRPPKWSNAAREAARARMEAYWAQRKQHANKGRRAAIASDVAALSTSIGDEKILTIRAALDHAESILRNDPNAIAARVACRHLIEACRAMLVLVESVRIAVSSDGGRR